MKINKSTQSFFYMLVILLVLQPTYKEQTMATSILSTNTSSSSPTLLDSPHFDHDRLNISISVQRGSTAHLHCKVLGLKDQTFQVAWYRRKGSEIHLLTWGFQTYHNDERFSLTYDHPPDWRLRIKFVQDRDAGTYECQVSTHPPMTRVVNIFVVDPKIQILDERGVVLSEKFYNSGSTIELQCVVSNIPTASSLQLTWYHNSNRLNYDARRGGVSVRTELRGTMAQSWLRVGNTNIADSGIYQCNVSELSSAAVLIHVVAEEFPAAIQASPKMEENAHIISSSLILLSVSLLLLS